MTLPAVLSKLSIPVVGAPLFIKGIKLIKQYQL